MQLIKLEKRNALRHKWWLGESDCTGRSTVEMISEAQSSAVCSGKAALLPSPQWAEMQRWTCGLQGLPLPDVRDETCRKLSEN